MRVILDTAKLTQLFLCVRHVVRHFALLLLLFLLIAPPADARRHLSKTTARTEALTFIGPIVDLLDVQRHVATDMVPPRKCRRISHVTVRCAFRAALYDGRVLHNHVTVHRQRDGLLGFKSSLDVLGDGVPVD